MAVVENIAGPIGARIHGVKGGPDGQVTANDLDLIVDAIRRRSVVVIKDQDGLSDDQLVTFVRQFCDVPGAGRLAVYHDPSQLFASRPEILYVTNAKSADGRAMGIGGNAEMTWHCNLSYQPYSSVFVNLSAVELPPSGGGNTHYIDLYAAYERLPAELKERLQGLSTHRGIPSTYPTNASPADAVELPQTVAPLLRVSPVTGRTSLFDVGLLTLIGVPGMPEDEGRALMEDLYTRTVRESDYVHVWEQGDMVMWDNIGLLHRRDPFDADERRLMRLVEVLEAEPSGVDPRRATAAAGPA